MKKLKLGIMGGTFDPIHYGHLFLAEQAYHQLMLDKVLFVPAGTPPHKKAKEYSTVADRVEMTRLAIAGNYHFELSLLEAERAGFSYSADTVAAFAEQFGNKCELWFICGADSMIEINSWYQPERLVSICRFATAARPGFDLTRIAQLPAKWQEKIDILDMPLLEISSTDIRQYVQDNKAIKYLLPDAVEEYIHARKLYCK